MYDTFPCRPTARTGRKTPLNSPETREIYINTRQIYINTTKTRQLGRPRSPAQQMFLNVGNSIKREENMQWERIVFLIFLHPPPYLRSNISELGNRGYNGYRFPLSLSTIWGNHLPFLTSCLNSLSTIWRNTYHLTSKWRGTFQYFPKKLFLCVGNNIKREMTPPPPPPS